MPLKMGNNFQNEPMTTTYITAEVALYIAITMSLISLVSGYLVGRRCRDCQRIKRIGARAEYQDIRKNIVGLPPDSGKR